MGVFDESDRRRAKVSQVRRPWPLSAWLLVGAMLVFNILLVAFIVRSELKRPGAPATSTPLSVDRPKTDASPEVNTPVNAPPSEPVDQGTNSPVNPGASLDGKTPPAEAMPAALPSTQKAKRPAINAQRASRTLHPALPVPMPRAGVYPPQERIGQTPAPARDVAASPGSSAYVASPGLAASAGTFGVPGNAASHPNAPAPSVLAPPATGNGSTARGTRPASTSRVAPVGLPAMVKGSAMQKKPVASVASQLEIIHLPAGKSENCGTDDAFLACPTLHTRAETPIPSDEP